MMEMAQHTMWHLVGRRKVNEEIFTDGGRAAAAVAPPQPHRPSPARPAAQRQPSGPAAEPHAGNTDGWKRGPSWRGPLSPSGDCPVRPGAGCPPLLAAVVRL